MDNNKQKSNVKMSSYFTRSPLMMNLTEEKYFYIQHRNIVYINVLFQESPHQQTVRCRTTLESGMIFWPTCIFKT